MPYLILTDALDTPFYQYQTKLTGLSIPETDYDHRAEVSHVYKAGGRRLESDERINAVDFYSNRPLKKLYAVHKLAEGAMIVRGEVKDMIESFDGVDRHQLFEVEVTQKKVKVEQPYFLWNVYLSQRAIDLNSGAVEMTKGFGTVEYPQIRRSEGMALDLLSGFEKRSHAWRDDQFKSESLMISDELFEALSQENLLSRVPVVPVR